MTNDPGQLSWDRCQAFLKENQPSTVKWLPLIRDGHLDWVASERVMDESGTISESSNVPIAISMTPMELASFDADAWHERLRQLKAQYPALGVVGLKKARRLMEENPGTAVQFDSASGFVSRIGVNIVAYKEAEAAGWNPNNGRIKEKRGKRKDPPSAPTEDMPALMPPSQPTVQPVSSLAIATAMPMDTPAEKVVDPVSRSVSPSLARVPPKPPKPLDLATSCLNMASILETLPLVNDKNVRVVKLKADEFIERKEEEGDESAQLPLVFLGQIPELANISREMTTAQTVQLLKDKFKEMSELEFKRGFYGIEAYFKPHPKGVNPYGYVAKKGCISIDHVLAQYFGMFNHPRFYALMPPCINSHLNNSPPITRMGFGITRHQMVLMHNWMKHVESTARKQKMQDYLIGNLVHAMPVHSLK